jgi:hypothetical protein
MSQSVVSVMTGIERATTLWAQQCKDKYFGILNVTLPREYMKLLLQYY